MKHSIAHKNAVEIDLLQFYFQFPCKVCKNVDNWFVKPICFATPNGVATHSLRSPDINYLWEKKQKVCLRCSDILKAHQSKLKQEFAINEKFRCRIFWVKNGLSSFTSINLTAVSEFHIANTYRLHSTEIPINMREHHEIPPPYTVI